MYKKMNEHNVWRNNQRQPLYTGFWTCTYIIYFAAGIKLVCWRHTLSSTWEVWFHVWVFDIKWYLLPASKIIFTFGVFVIHRYLFEITAYHILFYCMIFYWRFVSLLLEKWSWVLENYFDLSTFHMYVLSRELCQFYVVSFLFNNLILFLSTCTWCHYQSPPLLPVLCLFFCLCPCHSHDSQFIFYCASPYFFWSTSLSPLPLSNQELSL